MSNPIFVLLDTNVLLYLVNLASPHRAAILSVFKSKSEGKIACAFAAHSLKDFFYISRKNPYNLTKEQACEWIRFFLDTCIMVEMTEHICRQALNAGTPDYEDNIIIASAQYLGCRFIVTYDEDFQRFSDSHAIQVITAEELQKLLG